MLSAGACSGFLTALAARFLLGLLEERRQALIGLALACVGACIVFWNDPGHTTEDLLFSH
jgi:drug/metabolite transporter (DMT)-like permease